MAAEIKKKLLAATPSTSTNPECDLEFSPDLFGGINGSSCENETDPPNNIRLFRKNKKKRGKSYITAKGKLIKERRLTVLTQCP